MALIKKRTAVGYKKNWLLTVDDNLSARFVSNRHEKHAILNFLTPSAPNRVNLTKLSVLVDSLLSRLLHC